MALPANALTTTSTMETELGITPGSATPLLERLIGVASGAIETYCGRYFGKQTVSNERVAGYGGPRIMVQRTPVSMVLGITIDGEVVSSDGWYLDNPNTGTIYSTLGWEWTAAILDHVASPSQVAGTEEKAYEVTYIGGYVLPKDDATTSPRTLPYDLEQACIIAVVGLYRGRGKYQKLVEDTTTGEMKPWYDYVLPPNCRALIDKYKRAV